MLCWDGVPGFINSSIPLKSISSSVMFSTPHICCALGVRPALDVSETPRFQPLLLQGTLLHQPSPSQSSGFLRCHCCLSATSGESRGDETHQCVHSYVLWLSQWLFASPS